MSDLQKEINEMREALSRMEAELERQKQTADFLDPVKDKDLPIDTPILVSDIEVGHYKEFYFAGWDERGRVKVFSYGNTLRSSKGDFITFKYAKRDYTAKSIINWLPNTGVSPTSKRVIYRATVVQAVQAARPDQLDWSLTCNNPIIEYVIIE